MKKIDISFAKLTLNKLSTKPWDKISFAEILNNKKNKSFNNKIDLLANLNRYFDYLLKEEMISLEKSSTKDMLFEVLMARLDILNRYRKSIKNILKFIISNPHKCIKILPSFGNSIILIATLSNININGIKGFAKIKIIFILYLVVIYTWNKDETVSLEKTMTVLDNYLTKIDNFVSLS